MKEFIRRHWMALITLSVVGLALCVTWVLFSDPSPEKDLSPPPISEMSGERLNGLIVLSIAGVLGGVWVAKKIWRFTSGAMSGTANTVRDVIKISLALVLTFGLCVLLISWREWEEWRDLQIGQVPTWAPKLLVTAIITTMIAGLLTATNLSVSARRWILVGSIAFVALAYADTWGMGKLSLNDLGRERAYAKQPAPVENTSIATPTSTVTELIEVPVERWSRWIEIPPLVRFKLEVSGRTLCQNASGKEREISPEVERKVGKIGENDKKFRLQSLGIFPTTAKLTIQPLSREERENLKKGLPLP